jgi:membrane protease YdiL (CAAX protease family)
LHSGGANFAAINGIYEWVAVLIYEMAYASSFISVELFFRGFLVLGFVRYLRGYAIVPMVACYCFLHFGKPLAETITSIFGGFVLGVFVYKTRNIWGGIIIHMGIALLMELFGYWQQ